VPRKRTRRRKRKQSAALGDAPVAFRRADAARSHRGSAARGEALGVLGGGSFDVKLAFGPHRSSKVLGDREMRPGRSHDGSFHVKPSRRERTHGT
jgi:hypothetical protein